MNLEELLGLILEVDPSYLTDATLRADVTNWDSLAHLSVVSGVEEMFDVLLSTSEMREVTSVAALRAILRTKGVVV